MTAICFTLWGILPQFSAILLGLQRRQLNRSIHSVAYRNRPAMTHSVAHHHLTLMPHPVRIPA